jgi:hypothetical protein
MGRRPTLACIVVATAMRYRITYLEASVLPVDGVGKETT